MGGTAQGSEAGDIRLVKEHLDGHADLLVTGEHPADSIDGDSHVQAAVHEVLEGGDVVDRPAEALRRLDEAVQAVINVFGRSTHLDQLDVVVGMTPLAGDALASGAAATWTLADARRIGMSGAGQARIAAWHAADFAASPLVETLAFKAGPKLRELADSVGGKRGEVIGLIASMVANPLLMGSAVDMLGNANELAAYEFAYHLDRRVEEALALGLPEEEIQKRIAPAMDLLAKMKLSRRQRMGELIRMALVERTQQAA